MLKCQFCLPAKGSHFLYYYNFCHALGDPRGDQRRHLCVDGVEGLLFTSYLFKMLILVSLDVADLVLILINHWKL